MRRTPGRVRPVGVRASSVLRRVNRLPAAVRAVIDEHLPPRLRSLPRSVSLSAVMERARAARAARAAFVADQQAAHQAAVAAWEALLADWDDLEAAIAAGAHNVVDLTGDSDDDEDPTGF